MRIAVIGAGYVGLVSAACFAEYGTEVVCVDRDPAVIARLKAGEIPIHEPGLEDLVARTAGAGRLRFTTDVDAACAGCSAVFIAVGTPGQRDGGADVSNVYAVARTVAAAADPETVIVTKSTVPVGTGRAISALLREHAPDKDLDVAANPEFLREGAAIDDFMRPDRVVVGAETDRAQRVLRALYRPLYLIETPVIVTSLETAELAKYAANAFLATKITFINQMADLCEAVGGDVHDVARTMGLDGRIGSKFLHPGPGFGGSCFPKDTQALRASAREQGTPATIVDAVVEANAARRHRMVEKIERHLDGEVRGATIAVLGMTFKPRTDDVRESPSLVIVPELQDRGAEIRAHDPKGMANAAYHLSDIAWCQDAYDAMKGADAVVIATEWNEYRNLDRTRMLATLARPNVVDLRNIYDPDEMRAAGFHYTCVGRTVGADKPSALAKS